MKRETMRERIEAMRGQLETERSSFLSHWKDLSDMILPRRSRWFSSDINRGDRRTKSIIDSTATVASRTLSSGLMAGITSPARTWFKLTTPDPDLADQQNIKLWLDTVTRRMAATMLRSNLYNSLPILYGDIGTFATSAMYVEEDFKHVFRTYVFPVGSYMVGNDDRGKVGVFLRDTEMTVRQIVDKFGARSESGEVDWTNISTTVRSQYDVGNFETRVAVCHAIFPNADHDCGMMRSNRKKYRSVYLERGTSGADEKYLSDSGYDIFPVLAPRWEVCGEDSYGTSCPGMIALGDIRQLQAMEKDILKAVRKMVDPPMKGPMSMRNQPSTILPGGITWVPDGEAGKDAFKPAHEVQLRIADVEEKQRQTRERINYAYYVPLFMMLSMGDRREMTATEVAERREEKLLGIGPVLEQLNQDLLDPLIDLVFEFMLRQNLIPEAPPELQGVELKVEYVSIMAQAQKAGGLASLDRFGQFMQQLFAIDPTSLDKVNRDALIDEYGDITGVAPKILRDEGEVLQIRQARAKAAQQREAAEMAAQAAKATKDLSGSSMEGDSALSRLVNQSRAGQLVNQ